MKGGEIVVHLDVKNVPELIWDLRREMAKMLREAADGEIQIVRDKLIAVAAEFEVGQHG